MKGKVIKFNGSRGTMIIHGENGNEYFSHQDECKKKITKGCMVSFDVVDEGKEHLRAVNIVKLSRGKRHPFYRDAERIRDFIKNNAPESDEKMYALRDCECIMIYFRTLEDGSDDVKTRIMNMYKEEHK